MRVGTKSVLFGAHCFFIHPWFVAWAWWKLYGFPWDLRLWIAFFVHDLGYIGKPNMDGPEGEKHVKWGARFMRRWFDWPWPSLLAYHLPFQGAFYWFDMCYYHSRFQAKKDGVEVSRLCYADKLAIVITPLWILVPMATWTGEIREYMSKEHQDGKYNGMHKHDDDRWIWYRNVQNYIHGWLEQELGRPIPIGKRP